MPIAFVGPICFSTKALTDQETARDWITASLKKGGFVSDRLLEGEIEGEMLIGRSVPQGLLFKVEVCIDPAMPLLPAQGGVSSPVISVRVLNNEETQSSFPAPIVCDGGVEHITTFPGNFLIGRLGKSNAFRTSPFNNRSDTDNGLRAGWAIQAGIPNVINSSVGCDSASAITNCWFTVSDCAWLPIYGIYASNGGPQATFRETWCIPATGCYAYALNDNCSYHAEGRGNFGGYGNVGLDPYGTPRLWVPRIMQGLSFGGSSAVAVLPWRNSPTDDYLPDSIEPILLFGPNGRIIGQWPNAVFRTSPNDKTLAVLYSEATRQQSFVNLAGVQYDPLDRVFQSKLTGSLAPTPWLQYMDSSDAGALHIVYGADLTPASGVINYAF